jgi:hypothetical protein
MDSPWTPPATRSDAPPSRAWEGRVARGFRLARVALEVVTSDRRLLALPALATLCSLLALAATAVLAHRLHAGADAVRVVAPVWIAAYAISFVTVFFNVALVYVVAARWRGEDASLRDGLAAARRRLRSIAGWAVLTTTVGLLLQLIERVTLGISQVVIRIVADVAWSVASFFVVPVLVVEQRGPVRSLRRSASVVRGQWMEGLAGATPIGLATAMLMIPLAGLVFIGFVLFVLGLQIPGLLAMIAGAIGALAVSVISGALTQIFTLAVYQHATGGLCFDGFPTADLERPRDGNPLRLLHKLRRRRAL